MKNLVFLLVAAILSLFLFGCEDTEKTDETIAVDPAGSAARAAQAYTQLEATMYDLINGDDPEQPSDIDLSTTYSLYVDALRLDPSNKTANFGAGIVGIIMITRDQTLQSLFDRVKAFAEADSMFEIGGPGMFKRNSQGGKVALQWSDVAIPISSPIAMVKAFTTMSASQATDPTFAEVQSLIREQFIPRLDTAITRLSNVTSDQSFTFLVSGRMQGDPGEDVVEIDLTEVYGTLAGLNALSGQLRMFCAYNFNIPEYTGEQMAALLTQGSSYGSLNSGGASLMSASHQNWLNAISAIETGINFLEHETDNQNNDLIRIDPLDGVLQADIDSVKHYIPKARNLLNNSEVFNVDADDDELTPNVDLRISLNSMFTSPLQDMKTLFPPYTVSLDTGYVVEDEYDWYEIPAHVTVSASQYYSWSRWFRLNEDGSIDSSYSDNIIIPEFETEWNQLRQRVPHFTQCWIDVYYNNWMSVGENNITAHVSMSYDSISHVRYEPVITWNATSFSGWVLPDPTIGGLLPGMTDASFKQTFGINGDDWERRTQLRIW